MSGRPAADTAAGSTVLLAVDVGLHMGLAEFDGRAQLLRCVSRHAPNRTVLRRLAADVVHSLPQLSCLVLEGGGPLAEIWAAVAARRGLQVLQVSATEWRRELLLCREQRNGRAAKEHALVLAEALRRRHGARRTSPLRDDAAEAALVGLWACWRLGLTVDLPDLRQSP